MIKSDKKKQRRIIHKNSCCKRCLGGEERIIVRDVRRGFMRTIAFVTRDDLG
jgi:hypothetical protein